MEPGSTKLLFIQNAFWRREEVLIDRRNHPLEALQWGRIEEKRAQFALEEGGLFITRLLSYISSGCCFKVGLYTCFFQVRYMRAFIGWNPLWPAVDTTPATRLPAFTYEKSLLNQCVIYIAVAANKASFRHWLDGRGKPQQAIGSDGWIGTINPGK